MRDLRMEVISSGLICMKGSSLGPGDLLAKFLEAGSDRGVEHGITDPDDDPTEDLRVDVGGQVALAAGLLGDPVADVLDRGGVEWDGRGHLNREKLVLLEPEP